LAKGRKRKRALLFSIVSMAINNSEIRLRKCGKHDAAQNTSSKEFKAVVGVITTTQSKS